jgi:uncharacterized protein YwgA
MKNLVEAVAAIVRLNGGEIAGKTRLQKTFYLLEAMELGFGVKFDYHRFGPYSAELIFAAEDAEALGYLTAGEYLGHHNVRHKTFVATPTAPDISDDDLVDERRNALNAMKDHSVLQLELAATAVYLRENGYPKDYWDVVRYRKPLKATDDQVERAESLIAELGL